MPPLSRDGVAPASVALAAIKAFFVEPVERPQSGSGAPAGRLRRGGEAATGHPSELPAERAACGVPSPPTAAPHGALEESHQAGAPAPPAAQASLALVAGVAGPQPGAVPAAPQPYEGMSPRAARPRPVIAVFGLAPGCGASTVAHALAIELAARDTARAAAVRCEPRRARGLVMPAWLSATRLSASPVSRLAGTLADFPGAGVRTAGRLCLVVGADRAGLAEGVPHLAPLVLDEGSVAVGGVAAAVADRSVVVTTPALEPALATLAAECIARVGPDPVLVVNRASGGATTPAGPPPQPDTPGRSGAFEPARLADAVLVPESRLAARVALRGSEPRGELQRAIVRLADRCRQ